MNSRRRTPNIKDLNSYFDEILRKHATSPLPRAIALELRDNLNIFEIVEYPMQWFSGSIMWLQLQAKARSTPSRITKKSLPTLRERLEGRLDSMTSLMEEFEVRALSVVSDQGKDLRNELIESLERYRTHLPHLETRYSKLLESNQMIGVASNYKALAVEIDVGLAERLRIKREDGSFRYFDTARVIILKTKAFQSYMKSLAEKYNRANDYKDLFGDLTVEASTQRRLRAQSTTQKEKS